MSLYKAYAGKTITQVESPSQGGWLNPTFANDLNPATAATKLNYSVSNPPNLNWFKTFSVLDYSTQLGTMRRSGILRAIWAGTINPGGSPAGNSTADIRYTTDGGTTWITLSAAHKLAPGGGGILTWGTETYNIPFSQVNPTLLGLQVSFAGLLPGGITQAGSSYIYSLELEIPIDSFVPVGMAGF